eukprot:COSAG02_NODE_906_length_16039_cov_4.410289_6_plen_171_part_00
MAFSACMNYVANLMRTMCWDADREQRTEHDSEPPGSARHTPPPATRAGSTGSVFRRGRASKQRQAPSRRVSLSPAASRSSSAGDTTAVAFGSTFSPKSDARMDELESPRNTANFRRDSVHSDVAASVHEKAAPVGRRSPLGSRRPRQDSPVERSLRCVDKIAMTLSVCRL